MIGDVLKTLGEGGSDIILSGGFVTTTTDRVTAVLYSLFAADWVGNMFVDGDAVLESPFQDLHNETATLDALLNIADAAQKSLQWLVRQTKIKSVSAASRIIDGGIIITQIDFIELDTTTTRIEVRKYPGYWEVRGLE